MILWPSFGMGLVYQNGSFWRQVDLQVDGYAGQLLSTHLYNDALTLCFAGTVEEMKLLGRWLFALGSSSLEVCRSQLNRSNIKLDFPLFAGKREDSGGRCQVPMQVLMEPLPF